MQDNLFFKSLSGIHLEMLDIMNSFIEDPLIMLHPRIYGYNPCYCHLAILASRPSEKGAAQQINAGPMEITQITISKAGCTLDQIIGEPPAKHIIQVPWAKAVAANTGLRHQRVWEIPPL
jgi:hypothetical protein